MNKSSKSTIIKTIETPRLILRDWRDEDFEHFARMNSDPLVMEYMPRILNPQDTEKLLERFQKHIKKHGFGMFALERKDDGAFVGTVGLNTVEFESHFTPAVEIAWRLDYGFWGKGYATEAAKAALDYGFKDVNLKEIVSFTVHDNDRSTHVMEKIGLKRDEDGNFEYPTLRKGHPLGHFVLYRLKKKEHAAI